MTMQIYHKITEDFDVQASMRDGTILRANIYRPAGEGRWPVLLTRLPYGKDFSIGTAVMDPAQVARRGYVVIGQETRRRFTSEGEWLPFFFQPQDCRVNIEWGPHFPSTYGNVGMYCNFAFAFTE